MQIDLRGKLAVVTGSTAGIGFAIARGLAGAGADVVINGRSQSSVDDALRRLKDEVASLPLGSESNLRGVAADLSTAEGVDSFIAVIGEADILVNNLGIFEPKPFFEIPDEDWEHFFQTNVMSCIRMSRHYTPKMIDNGWGRVIFISSASGVATPVEMVHYGMTKTAQLAISRGLAETAKDTGVTVNAVLPGPTASEGVKQFVEDMASGGDKSAEEVEAEFFNEARPSSLIQRFETVEEIANMVVFVASKEASAVTGSTLRVDGGVVRSII